MTTPARSRLTRPRLPEPRGPVSAGVVEALRSGGSPVTDGAEATADPYGEDLQLALYVLYELHYQGFAGAPADDSREWDPELLALRATLEQPFLAALRADAERPASAAAALDALLVEPAGHRPGSVSHHLRRTHRLPELREYAALRSLYHLKEADPHAWMIPRLRGRAKAGLAAVEYDEFGAGRAEDVHARLYAELMAELGLEPAYGHYLDAAPAAALATVNLMSLFGLHRALRGALVGHFAAVEVTSSPARGGSRTRCARRGPVRRRSASTRSTSRRTPSTNRWCAGTWWPGSSPTNRNSTPTWPSESPPPPCWRTGSGRCCSTPGPRTAAPSSPATTPTRWPGPPDRDPYPRRPEGSFP